MKGREARRREVEEVGDLDVVGEIERQVFGQITKSNASCLL
jgi:hypothetical protein